MLGEQPNQAPALHRRASEWYEQNGLAADAIRHALAAEDFERAARLIELVYPAMDTSFQSAAWLGWVRKLPEELVRARPALSVGYAWALLDGGEMEASQAWLQEAEGRLEGSAQRMVVADEAQLRTLPAMIALARSYHAQVRGDIGGTVKYAELALELSPEEDPHRHAMAAATLGMAYWTRGDLDAAQRALSVWINSCQKVGNIIFAIASSAYLAEIIVAQGRLSEAESIYKQSLQLAAEQGQPVLHVSAQLYLGLGLLYHEQGDPEAAAQHLHKSGELGEQTVLIDWPCRWRLAQARLKESEGDLEAALDLLDEARRLYVRNPVPDIHPIDALKARVHLRQGRLSEALAWARARGLTVDDNLSYLGEFEHITLARALIAEYQSHPADRSILDAMKLLERLLEAAEQGGRLGSVIEILALQSLALQALGDIPLALAALARALTLAEPEGYIRIFVNEGPPMAELLSEAAAHGVMPDYTGKLLAAFEPDAQHSEDKPDRSLAGTRNELLSQRELEVLQLIAQGLSNHEICNKLFLALDTVKGHNRRIYGKLQVQNRTEAVARARQLGLL